MQCKPLSCVFGNCVIPQRYVMAIMMHFALLNAYHLRVVLNVAIREMIQPKQRKNSTDACPQFTEEIMNVQGGTYNWPDWIEAFILYAFYIGYIFTHIPGGWLADRFGGRHILGTCMLLSTIITLLFPLAVQRGDYIAAIVLRGILGLAQGPLIPTISTFLQNWAPKKERGFLGGIAFSGANLGTVTGKLFTGVIIKNTNSWPMAFYIYGLLALVWYVFYIFMVFSYPTTHPFITPEEAEFLQDLERKKKYKVPWLKIIGCIQVWAILAGQFGHNYIYMTLVTDLPKYMKDILKLNIQMNAAYSALPFLALWISSNAFGYFADFMTNRDWMSVVNARKLYTSFANVTPAICLIIAVYLGCSRAGAVFFYTFGLALNGPFYSGTKVNVNDITKHFGGTIMAMVNGLGASAGIIGPMVVGHLTPNATLAEWHLVFWIMLGVSIFTTIIFIMFASGERQDWDYPENEEPK